MVICKFFLQGNCRFGENCKFEHQLNDGRQQHSSVLRQQNYTPNTNPNPNTNVDTNALIRAVANDMLAAEKGGQWLLSCYAPFKEKPNFPGFDEQSFEEVRLEFYKAQHSGTVNQYKEQLQMSLQGAVQKIRALQNPSPDAIITIKNIYNTAPGSSSSVFANPPSNAFGNNQNTVFTNPNANNIFGGQQNNFANTSVFSQANQQQNASAKSIFLAANQKLFGPTQQQNPVFNANPNQNIFANVQQNNSNFNGANPFGQTFTQNQNFNGMQPNQQVLPPFGLQQTFPQQQAVPGFNVQQQGGTLFPPQQQTRTLPFAAQQNTSPFGHQPQGNSPLMAMQQNPASPFATQPNPMFSTKPMQNAMPYSTTQQPQSTIPFNAQTIPQPTAQFNNANNVFGNNLQPTELPPSSIHSNNIFASAAPNVFGGGTDNNKDPRHYSKLEALSESDIKSYTSDSFEFGNIPENAPTIEMCF